MLDYCTEWSQCHSNFPLTGTPTAPINNGSVGSIVGIVFGVIVILVVVVAIGAAVALLW